MKFNYTSVCHYCGEIFQSNKSSAKYCCHNHNFMFHQYGSQINCSFINFDGVINNCEAVLEELSNGDKSDDGWGPGRNIMEVYPQFDYMGSLPLGDELILAGSYVIKKSLRPRARQHIILNPSNSLQEMKRHLKLF